MALHLEVTSLDPADPSNTPPLQHRGLKTGDVDQLVACINAALQDLWDSAPTAVRFARVGIALRAPVTVTLTLTHESNSIAAFPQYAPWMDGCTIRLEGAAHDNELVDGTSLLRPYLGPTGTVSATVYGDCASPGPEVIAVLDPIGTCGSSLPPALLRRVSSRAEFETALDFATRSTGAPEVCFVETRYFPSQSRLGIRLRVQPMPLEATLLTYGARLNAPAIIAADLGGASDPGTTFPIPGGWEESVLLPLALQRLSIHPDFTPQSAKTEIARQAVVARKIMMGAVPQRSEARLYPTFR